VDDILLLNKFFFRLSIGPTCFSCEDIARQLCDGAEMAIFDDFFASSIIGCISSEPRAERFRPAY